MSEGEMLHHLRKNFMRIAEPMATMATGAISGGGTTYEMPDQRWLDNIMAHLEGVDKFERGL